MTTMTQAQADRIHERTAKVVAKMRADADALEAQGRADSAALMRQIADSRERAGNRARAEARIGRA